MKILKKEYENFTYNELNIMNLVESINLYLDKANLEMIKAISTFLELISKDYINFDIFI